MGNDASRLMLEIRDKLLILHFEYGSLGKDGPPMLHQLRIGATVATEFGKVVGVVLLSRKQLCETGQASIDRIADGVDDLRVR